MTRQEQPSKKSRIVVLLARLGARRQAKLDKEDYLLFANDLEAYSLESIEGGLNAIAAKPRREGETAFPDVATILEAVRGAIRSSRPSGTEKWGKYLDACKEEGVEDPDEEIKALMAKLDEKLGIDRPREIDLGPHLLCPKCSFVLPFQGNFRFMSPAEMRELADVVEKMR